MDAVKSWQTGTTGQLTHFMLGMLEEAFVIFFKTLGIKEKNE
jgi:hypothetical protein